MPRVVKYQRSEFPTFSNVLLHVNGAKLEEEGEGKRWLSCVSTNWMRTSTSLLLTASTESMAHYFAVSLLQEKQSDAKWEIPAEIFIDLDDPETPPHNQAQIFIDVNFYQKKVDRSLVADLFPTARGRAA